MQNIKNNSRIFFLLVILFNIIFSISAQETCQEIEDKEAIKNFEKGIDRKKNKKEARVMFLKKALELEPDYADANLAYAREILVTQKLNDGSFKPAEPYFLKVIQACPKLHSDPYYYLGFIYYEEEKYEEAAKYLKQFIDFSDDDDKKFSKDYDFFLSQAKEMLKYAKFFAEIFAHPVPFDPKPVQGICTERDEYLPIISPDDELVLFTRRMPFSSRSLTPGLVSEQMMEVFTYSERKNGVFDQGEQMPEPFNKNSNEGGATLSIDNKHLFYTICKDEGGAQMNCDIYYSDYVKDEWTEIQNMGPKVNNPERWDSQPSLAADGRTLYFASDRAGGYGGTDIYMTVRDATSGDWGVPVNLGPTINTEADEKSPFIHSDSETLYFSSKGHIGLGKFDIFFTRKNEKGEWMKPKNIGYPINTEADDLGFFVSTDGKLGYFASNSSSKVTGKSIGGWDIYSFDLYKEARPDAVAFIKGEMKDENGEQLQGAVVEIKNARTKEKVGVVMDTLTGQYAAVVNLKKKDDYIVTVKKEGFAFNSEIVSTKDSVFDKPVKLDFEVKPIKKGAAYTLNNIYYETNSAELKAESKIVIEEFVDFLKVNPGIKIEIHGHTDNVGDTKSNMALSADRAFTVYDMLMQKGISKTRLLAFKGFGETRPIASNGTEEGRAKNRRTEFLIIEK